jgi:hypothetical protein
MAQAELANMAQGQPVREQLRINAQLLKAMDGSGTSGRNAEGGSGRACSFMSTLFATTTG